MIYMLLAIPTTRVIFRTGSGVTNKGGKSASYSSHCPFMPLLQLIF